MNKKYIFENNEKILIETNNLNELAKYILENIGELIQYDIMETPNYTYILYHGYSLRIKKIKK